jgi:hypothetical protein
MATANSTKLTRLTIELTAEDLHKINQGALLQSTVCEDEEIIYLLEIYASLAPGKKLEGRILEDWD